MAPSVSARLSGANTPHGSQGNDEDIINRQIQADLNLQAETHRTTRPKKFSKRKSREIDEDIDIEESHQKRRKEKDQGKRKKNDGERASEGPWNNVLDVFNDSSFSGAELVPKPTNGIDRAGNPILETAKLSSQDHTESSSSGANIGRKKMEATNKYRHDSGLAAVSGRSSLGMNRDALLMSILKGCSPDKPTKVSAKRTLPFESKGEDASEDENAFEGHYASYAQGGSEDQHASEDQDASETPQISSSPKVPSKKKQRQRVSMIPILPKGYKPGLESSKARFHCPIEGCEKLYTRRTTLGEHMNTSHRGQKLRDNLDGTMTKISLEDYQLAISGGNDLNFVEIPDKPLPPKATSRKSNGNNDKDISTGEVPREDSGDSDVHEETRTSGSKASKPRPAVKTPTTKQSTSSKSHGISENELEDWEIEPGVISGSDINSGDDSETEHNTAFSSLYTIDTGVKFSGVHFQIIRVPSGSIAPSPDIPYLRICSVAVGKVQVQVGDKQFSIGQHGMWRIKASKICTITNRHYSEAVIHVSTIDEPFVETQGD